MSTIRVLRPMTEDDLDAVLPLQRAAAIAGLGHIFPQQRHSFPIASVRDRWRVEIHDPAVDCFVIDAPGGSIAGFAATRGSEFLHFGIAVAMWGSGTADLAHDEVIAYLTDAGHRNARLRVFQANARARRFYERHGWYPTGEKSYSSFPPYPVLLGYAKPLR